MSEKLLRFLLSELNIVRIRCRNPECRTIVEIPIEDLGNPNVSYAHCEFCHADFNPTHGDTIPLNVLGKALNDFRKLKAVVDLEFVLPADD